MFFDDNAHHLAGTDWIDADTGSNLALIKSKTSPARKQTTPLTWNHLTRAERYARGFATEQDLIEIQNEKKQHQEWLASDEGKAWLEKSGLTRNFGG
jgi:hypothetical protein